MGQVSCLQCMECIGCCAVLCRAVLCCVVLCCAVLCCAVLCCALEKCLLLYGLTSPQACGQSFSIAAESNSRHTVTAIAAQSCAKDSMQLQSLQAALSLYLAASTHRAQEDSHASDEADDTVSVASTGACVWRTPTAAVWQEVKVLVLQAASILGWADHQLFEFRANRHEEDTKVARELRLLRIKQACMQLVHDLLIGHVADGKVNFHSLMEVTVMVTMPVWGSSSPDDRDIDALGLALLCRMVEEEVHLWAANHGCLDDQEVACQHRQAAEAIWSLLGEAFSKLLLC